MKILGTLERKLERVRRREGERKKEGKAWEGEKTGRYFGHFLVSTPFEVFDDTLLGLRKMRGNCKVHQSLQTCFLDF